MVKQRTLLRMYGTTSQLKTVQSGQSVTLPVATRSGYTFHGWSVPSKGICTDSRSSYTYKPTHDETVIAQWTKSSSKASTKNTNSFSLSNPYYNKNGLLSLARTQNKEGGFADFTGLAWMDGTPSKPEAVLNALQTEHFIKFTNALDNMFGSGNITNTSGSVSIGNISFNVESMSSPEDGEKAFNAFVNKFKEIGSQTGIKINSFKNTL